MDDRREKQFGKEVIRFGKWIVTEEGILYERPEYFIEKANLWKVWMDKSKDKWDWLIHLTEKTWLEQLDLYQLNTAFFFAVDYFKALKPSNCPELSVWRTLQFQKAEYERRLSYRSHETL